MDLTGLDRRVVLGIAYHDMQRKYRKGFDDHIPHVSCVSFTSSSSLYTGYLIRGKHMVRGGLVSTT